MDFSPNGSMSLIESVKKHPCLWKSDMEQYKMLDIREEAWKSVMEENSIESLKEAKYEWKKLRDVHRQVISKKIKTVNGKSSKKWKYEDQMEFLVPYIKIRPPAIEFSQDPDFQDDYEDNEEIEMLDDDDFSESTSAKQPRKTERKEDVTIYLNDLKREKRSLDRNSSMSRSQVSQEVCIVDPSLPRTALESFFTSMCEMTSTLPEQLQIRVERKIFEVVMEAREINLQDHLGFFEN